MSAKDNLNVPKPIKEVEADKESSSDLDDTPPAKTDKASSKAKPKLSPRGVKPPANKLNNKRKPLTRKQTLELGRIQSELEIKPKVNQARSYLQV